MTSYQLIDDILSLVGTDIVELKTALFFLCGQNKEHVMEAFTKKEGNSYFPPMFGTEPTYFLLFPNSQVDVQH